MIGSGGMPAAPPACSVTPHTLIARAVHGAVVGTPLARVDAERRPDGDTLVKPAR
jgi:hypothetical protein